MAVTVQLDSKLAALAGGTGEIDVSADTVGAAVAQIVRAHPALQSRLLNCEGEIRSIVRVTRNGAPTTAEDPVHDGDTVRLETV